MKKTNGFAGLLMAAMLLLSGGAKAQASIPQIVADTLRANHPAPYTNITKEAFDAQAEALTQNWDVLEEQGEARFALCRWVASLKDEHTQLFDGAWYNVRTPYVVMAVEGKYVIVQGQECAKPYLGWTIAANGIPHAFTWLIFFSRSSLLPTAAITSS